MNHGLFCLVSIRVIEKLSSVLRVTGSCHEYSDPRNVLPTYSIEFVDTLIDEIQDLKAQVAAFRVNEEDHIPA